MCALYARAIGSLIYDYLVECFRYTGTAPVNQAFIGGKSTLALDKYEVCVL